MFAAVLIAAIVAGAALLSSGEHITRAQQPPVGGSSTPTLVLECFRIEKGANPRAVVRLTTANFARDDAVVTEATRYCELANKYVTPDATTQLVPPTQQQALECYNLLRGDDPNDAVVLETANFGKHEASVRRATMMCENAIKVRTTAAGQTTTYGDPASQLVLECFELNAPNIPNVRTALVTNNFGPDRALVLRPKMMCEQAKKERPGLPPFDSVGTATGTQSLVFECFSVEAPNRSVAATLTTQNFKSDDVVIRRADLLCEQATKTLLFDTPNPIPNPAVGGETHED
jgi:hypothetical protein